MAKRIIVLIFGLLIWVHPTYATFTLVQQVSSVCVTAATTCDVVVTALGVGNLVVVGAAEGTNTATLSSVTAAGETFTVDTGCRNAGDATSGGTDCGYTLASVGGATTVTCNFSVSTASDCNLREFSFTGSSVSKDASGNVAHLMGGGCTNCAGVALTLTGTNDVIEQGISCSNTCTAITTPYTGVFLSDGNADAQSLNTTSGAAPTWTQTTKATAAGHGIAFKEAAAVGGCTEFIALLGAGCK